MSAELADHAAGLQWLGNEVDPRELPDVVEHHWRDCGWGSAAIGINTVLSLFLQVRHMNKCIESVLRPMELTFARYELLMRLLFSDTGTMTVSGLGEVLQVHPASVSSALDRLVAAGLVDRMKDHTDGRVVHAAITPSGRRSALAATYRLNSTLFTQLGVDDPDLKRMNGVLRAFRINSGDFAPRQRPSTR